MTNSNFIKQLQIKGKTYTYYDIIGLSGNGMGDINRLPYSIRILVENLIRKFDNKIVTENDLREITNWQTSYNISVSLKIKHST